MLKPDAVINGHVGAIINKITGAGFKIIAMKYTSLSEQTAGEVFMKFITSDLFTKIW